MAVQVETQGQLQEFLGLLARRKWQVLLPLGVVLSLGIFVAVVIPKKFVVKTQVELRPVGVSVSPKEAANAQYQIKSRERIKKVTQALQNREYLAMSPTEQEDWLEAAQKALKVTTVQSTNQATSFVNIEYSDVNVEWAADFLRALRNDWISDVIERDRRKVEDEAKRYNESRRRIEKQYQREEQELTEVLRANGLSATQPVPGADATRTEDPVFERLRRNEADLEKTNASIEENKVLRSELQRRVDEMPLRLDLEETVVGGFSNAEELAKVEVDILDAQRLLAGIRPPHSRFKETQEKIRALETRRDQLNRMVSKGELQQRSKANPEIEPIRARLETLGTDLRVAEARRVRLVKEIEDDQRRVAELQNVYRDVRVRKDTIARLSADLAAAEASYQVKSREVELMSSPLANPFEITQEVAPPSKPTEPNPWLIVSFGLVAGLAIGLGLAVVLEYSKNCFRTVADIGRVMAIPVLGSVDRIVTRREVRLGAVRRIAVAAASIVFVGAVLFVTWAWANDAKYLSQDVRDAIEGLRARLK
ncbi:MAG: hypothetical protein NTY35_14855 [Planctomycetota bacterium]|nr:hypothetical protein [Planctomycetota bacterium]